MSTHMEVKIHAYIDQLFAGIEAGERLSEVKLEIYQNTLDRYNDFLNEGLSPDRAYDAAIAGIGDIGEILESLGMSASEKQKKKERVKGRRKLLYNHFSNIVWMLTLIIYFIVSFATSVWHMTWILFLITTALLRTIHAAIDLRYADKPDLPYQPSKEHKKLRSTISGILWLIILIAYLAVSYISSAWYITWIIFFLGDALESLLSMYFIIKQDPLKKKGNA